MSFSSCWKNKFECQTKINALQREVDALNIIQPFKNDWYREIRKSSFKVVDTHEVVNAVKKLFGEKLEGTVIRRDTHCVLYPATFYTQCENKIPSMYNHTSFLTGILPDNAIGDGSDCDNREIYRNYWFHLAMPGCCVISVSGSPSPHRFCGLMASDGQFVWFGGTLKNYETLMHVILS